MGNRAVITTKKKGIGIYVHWNGGRDSIDGFLAYCKAHGYREPNNDNYGWAYLAGVISNFFGDGLSIGIGKYENLDTDNWDNGVYIIDGWKVVDREFNHNGDDEVTSKEELVEILQSINECQPVRMQLKPIVLEFAAEDYLNQYKMDDNQ